MNVRRTLTLISAALALTVLGAGQAQADDVWQAPTSKDVRTMHKATKACSAIEQDTPWVGCQVGSFMARRSHIAYPGGGLGVVTGTWVTPDDRITYDGGSVQLERASVWVGNLDKHTKVRKADKRALRAANAACIDLPRTNVRWYDCTLGLFMLERGRVITSNDVTERKRADGVWVLRLVHGSHHIG